MFRHVSAELMGSAQRTPSSLNIENKIIQRKLTSTLFSNCHTIFDDNILVMLFIPWVVENF